MNTNLPIFASKNQIVEAVKNHDTVIITAETGSGKSTQVPQYLHEAGFTCVLTQPRRIACVSLAKRVVEEIGSDIASYQTAFESNINENTKILFRTDGYQLVKGLKDNWDILIIDEIHEWNLNIETLIAWIRKYREDGNNLKVILMSATMDSASLKDYFKDQDVCHLDIKGRLFKVDKHIGEKVYINAVIENVRQGKNVLAFRSGKKEISETVTQLKSVFDKDVVILPLHSELAIEEQNACFKSYDLPKIVVSTNIAQTSVTIPDINVVVDDGSEKIITVENGVESLVFNKISLSDIEQRAGRAGRVSKGEYYLCADYDYELKELMKDRKRHSSAEIERLLLDKVVLRLMSVGIDASEVKFYHQPPQEKIVEAKNLLKMLKAIDDNGITDFGKALLQYPVSVRSSIMLEKAKEFNILDDMISIISIIESGSLINRNAEASGSNYRTFTNENRSDLLCELEIYHQILDGKFADLKLAGLNGKVFSRIREFDRKLRDQLDNVKVVNQTDDYYEKFIKCLYAANPDKLFNSMFRSADGLNYRKSRTSCINENYDDIYIGYPINISFKDKWGFEQQMALATNLSIIPKNMLETLLDEQFINEEVHSWFGSRYDVEKEQFELTFIRQYMEIKIGERVAVIGKNDPEFADCMVKYADAYERALERDAEEKAYRPYREDIEIDGRERPAYRDPSRNAYVIDLEQALKMPEKTEYLDSYGEVVMFKYKTFVTSNPLEIIDYKKEDLRVEKNKRIKKERPQKKIEGFEQFMREYKDYMGAFNMCEENGEKTLYYGLARQKDDIVAKYFENESEYQENLKQNFNALFKKHIGSICPQSGFVFVKNGRKIVNESAEENKQIFREFVDEIMDGLTIDNAFEQIDYLKDVYQECIGNIVEYTCQEYSRM